MSNYGCQAAVAAPPRADFPLVVRKSVHSDCIEEENRHRWIESEKAGYDLGESAIRKWVADHWTTYLRAKWVEHLQGKCFWIELDRDDFGLLQHEFQDCPQLLDLIIDKLKSGQENLHLLVYAVWDCNDAAHVPVDKMIEILESLDINSRRIAHRFEAGL